MDTRFARMWWMFPGLLWALAFALVLASCGGDGGDGGGGDGGGANPVQQCIAEAPEATECVRCGCSSCLAEIRSCDKTGGCPAIRECGVVSGCSGADCYLGGACKQVIDDNGGPFGAAAGAALVVGQCADGAGCPCGTAE